MEWMSESEQASHKTCGHVDHLLYIVMMTD